MIIPPNGFVTTKTFTNYPCAHRQWRHDGNCKLIHGYSRSFVFWFGAHQLDKSGFGVDFGDLDWIKHHLEYMFDHTLLLAADDPELEKFYHLDRQGVVVLRTLPEGIGMEGTSKYLCEWADAELRKRTKGRCWVISVEAKENDKNSVIYFNPDAGFHGWL